MEKKKINKEDLELNYEILGSNTIDHKTNATSEKGYETDNTCDPTVASAAFCKTTVDDQRCDPDYTNKCSTLVCQTINCVDSNSRAQYCCPLTQQDGCRQTVDYCATQVTCNISKDICPVTDDIRCVATLDNCNYPY